MHERMYMRGGVCVHEWIYMDIITVRLDVKCFGNSGAKCRNKKNKKKINGGNVKCMMSL